MEEEIETIINKLESQKLKPEELQLLKSDREYKNFDEFYNYFKSKLDNEIEKYKKKGRNLHYKKGYDKNILNRIIQAFQKNDIPVIIKGKDGKNYVNNIFDEAVERFIYYAELGKRNQANPNKIEIHGNNKIASLDEELNFLLEKSILSTKLSELEKEFNNIIKNIELNKENFTPNEVYKVNNDLIKVKKQIEDIKLELAKKEGNLKYIGEIIKQSRKTMALILSTILAGSGVGVGVGVSKLSEKKNEDVRNKFIEANKHKLDSLTNENVRNNKENLKLLKKSLALGYLPKNIQIKK